jgi:hypothetical protein
MSAHSGRLQHAIKDLRDKWDIASELWDDVNSREFQKVHVIPLQQHGKHAVVGMEKLAETLAKIRAQCKDDEY